MAIIDYLETLNKMNSWLITNRGNLVEVIKHYKAVSKAILTGEEDLNNISLTAEQIAILQTEKATIELWIKNTCSAWDVEPIEVKERG